MGRVGVVGAAGVESRADGGGDELPLYGLPSGREAGILQEQVFVQEGEELLHLLPEQQFPVPPDPGGLNVQDAVRPVQMLEDFGGRQREEEHPVAEPLRVPEAQGRLPVQLRREGVNLAEPRSLHGVLRRAGLHSTPFIR